MSPYRLLAIVLIWCGVAAAFWYQLQGREQSLQRSVRQLGTQMRVVVFDRRPQAFAAAADAALGEMARIAAMTDARRPDSEVARLSSAQGTVSVAPELLEIITAGLRVEKISGGAFDMTLGRLRSLWGFDASHPHRPAPEAIQAVLADSGPDMLAVESGRVVKRSRAWIDLHDIAAGYGLDRAARILTRAGVRTAAIEAGDNVLLVGRRPTPWNIDIRHPRKADALLATLVLREPRAVFTVADGARFFEQNGVRYHDRFDPSTGMPAATCRSVTVVSPLALDAAALASAAFVLGPDAGLALLERYPQTWGVMVAADGRVLVSPGFADRVLQP